MSCTDLLAHCDCKKCISICICSCCSIVSSVSAPIKKKKKVSPSKGIQGTTRGKETILLTSVEIEPTTFGLDLQLQGSTPIQIFPALGLPYKLHLC